MKVRTRWLKGLAGRIDFYLRRDVGDRRGPFNSQRFRQSIFEWIVDNVGLAYIVETGTHRGGTTAYLARRGGVPVFGVEIDEQCYTFARLRLRDLPLVSLTHGDSREWLDRLLHNRSLPPGVGFYYLDAHWNDDLPLAGEIDRILGARPESLLMIDDFQVPDDDGYGYDDYGEGKALSLPYVRPAVERMGLRVFFPACPSGEETGSRRGTLILVGESAPRLEACPLLREWRI